VRKLGSPARPPLLIIHGGPTWDHSYLLPAVAELTDVAHVILYDQRGCGRSARVPPHGDLPESQLQPEFLADDAAALLQELGAPATVLGFSFGGRIAMRLVERHPALVDRLIVASTTAYRDYDLASDADYVARSAQCSEVDFTLTADGALSRAMAYAYAPLQIWRLDRLPQWHEILARVRFTSDYNGPYAAGTLRPAAPDNAADILAAWSRPTLILHGQKDLTFPVEVARRLHRALPASTVAEIPEAGHMTHFDAPEAWLTAIRAFLRDTHQLPDRRIGQHSPIR
jgi:pimeloyl-ACP methyl ester carboxylesterase